ncbi:hypothetical protein [Nocardia macrotermitis]|uniref:Uncharacterized protein n=1 Tax=Nocardia macrotermitis TaxID=2585198 RepID=A0A7K0CWJ5_9NOCA|nr:hypothetical protein [Nocardia macrotermitis]MQY17887.1 hypothetical protein [Nocardia macrotermitis]
MIESTARQAGTALHPATTLRLVTVIFTVALLVHASDHLRRGMSSISSLVMTLGFIQLALALATVVLIALRHRWAPTAAMVVGFASAAGFLVVHLLPDWFGPLSDSFINPPASANVTGFSWFAALFEILADLALGVAAVRARRSWP